ncbi:MULTISPECIES: acyl-CoA thioesterase [Mycobacteriaceae]|uniref:4-hydroxybenzoyl-CoA thioesterase n=1 Tax=Mycolicibacterium neoaurum VKM Ac-1815D TaxID=700508 RepID=V5X4I6_MYCNE|nr:MULTISPECIES: thioesterase family protein [Mycobacteriaceae]AHC23375.1 4-hydroxybenzoyl-CoA thioesterase [Mycolicibacterium neoaurum VKM Ac-1815D]AMO04099.1 4-hydroxybenzoyl-CoA thioesterase [Mycolicibacterium neoaurum]AXK77632.1 acyl-CoA thioesterase [Mycolicibacterium neoaurum]KJQ49888.1 4-hydroxybenzoyl-CoA thioesterase [Mycolicibacterium neoaurum]KUM07677.1 4-hydroxybenzoyl-CoA thioesterase [Mycolicibacterium neoaurum]
MEYTSADFGVHWPVQTRWTDNDMFGHLNNAVYYQLFDTAINAWIGRRAGVDAMAAPWLAVVAESSCRYYAELQFPADLVVGLAVTRLGTSSVTYRTGLWAAGDARPAAGLNARPAAGLNTRPAAGLNTRPAAVGSWVHVYVDRQTRRPVPIPEAVRALLQSAVHDATPD